MTLDCGCSETAATERVAGYLPEALPIFLRGPPRAMLLALYVLLSIQDTGSVATHPPVPLPALAMLLL